MDGRSRWGVVVVIAGLVLAGCRADPYEGWPDPTSLAPICEQFETTDEIILEAIRPEQTVSWDEARSAADELEAVVSATELPTSEVTPGFPFPDLRVAASSLRRGVQEAAQLSDWQQQFEAVYGPVEPIELGVEPTIDAGRDPDLAFVSACGDRDLGDLQRPLEPFDVVGLVALGGTAVTWLATRRRRRPAARTAHTVLGGVLVGTVAATVVMWAIGAVLLSRDSGITGVDLAVALIADDPEVYLFAFLTGGTTGALVGTFLAWRQSRRDELRRGG